MCLINNSKLNKFQAKLHKITRKLSISNAKKKKTLLKNTVNEVLKICLVPHLSSSTGKKLYIS
jgi:hypothetical protein